MKRTCLLCAIVVAAFFMVPAPATAQVIFSDGFETYAAPGVLPPQGGWNDFGGSQPITVSTTRAHTGTKSMRLSEGTDTLGGTSSGYGSDIFRNFGATPITSGIVNFSFWQFVDTAV